MRPRLILMLKFPAPGAVKTRLVPTLGERRASELYRALVRHTLGVVERFARETEVEVEVRITRAPDAAAARAWLGGTWRIREQGDGDLGERLARALSDALAEGASAAIAIGGDCPELGVAQLQGALNALDGADLVLGPATDGGYYLIGLRRFLPALFVNIAWSTDRVREQTLAAARGAGARYRLLDPLSDVDEARDLPVWARTAAARGAGRGRVSVIVPARNEADHLPSALAAAAHGSPHEIIVVDGGSTDRTREVARAADAIVLAAPRGRAVQMNRGAAIATGEFLLFLHADTLLPAGYAGRVAETLADARVALGAFTFGLAEEFRGARLIERLTNWRARACRLPYGDQALFVRRDDFVQLGGFAEMPVMEDFEFVRRACRRGRVHIVPLAAKTSGRRWREFGLLRTALRHQAVLLGYLAGLDPARLAGWRGAASAAPQSSPPQPGITPPPSHLLIR